MDGGTGLGLSIVKGILDMHEARIGIVNKDVDRGVKAVIAFNT
jgi:nitrogen fixation/metabolism regulation signal transduction histidine kinase